MTASQSNPLGIIGAMEEEIALLLQHMDGQQSQRIAGVTFTSGLLHGRPVVVCKSGVGKVNAALTTQLLIDRFAVTAILFTGVAGAVHPELQIGDIVISSSCQQHDMDVTPLGYPRGAIPYQEISDFPASPQLVHLAEQACKKGDGGSRHVVGRVLSGDQFIADPHKVRELYDTLQGACVEMEGAAVAQVSYINHVPFVVIRCMSDKADGSAHANYAEFTVHAANRSFSIVSEMVQML